MGVIVRYTRQFHEKKRSLYIVRNRLHATTEMCSNFKAKYNERLVLVKSEYLGFYVKETSVDLNSALEMTNTV